MEDGAAWMTLVCERRVGSGERTAVMWRAESGE